MTEPVGPRAIFVSPGIGRPGGVSIDVGAYSSYLSGCGYCCAQVSTIGALRRAATDVDRAVVNVWNCLPTALIPASFALAKLRGWPLVWTPVFHPMRPNTWDEYTFGSVMRAFDTLAPRLARIADAVTAMTEEEADFFRRLRAKEVVKVPSGVALPAPEPDEAIRGSLIERFHGSGGPLILIVGRENKRKGIPFGVATFEVLRQMVPDARMLLAGPEAGSGPGQPGLTSTGWLSPLELTALYGLVDIVFVPSLYDCGPRVIPEALRAGTPVVVTNRVGTASLIRGVVGDVVSYGDVTGAAQTLRDLLADSERMAKYATAGPSLVQSDFSLSTSCEALAGLFDELLSTSGRERIA
jgi:glycosyltransferase involved in cell wall biosynthesis